jgi:hypothetical protein
MPAFVLNQVLESEQDANAEEDFNAIRLDEKCALFGLECSLSVDQS